MLDESQMIVARKYDHTEPACVVLIDQNSPSCLFPVNYD
jgi:hypothetical protein